MPRPILIALFATLPLLAQQQTTTPPISKKQQQELRKELQSPNIKWLTEDVAYIITGEERKAFTRLSTDDERDQFIEQFWLRRDPTPDTQENEFREEHYRRIAYANERFASGIPGWKTDRGRIYIRFGPPDEIEPHPSGGQYNRPIEQGGGNVVTFPFELWRYRYIEGVGSDVVIEFVDPTMTGEYHITIDPNEKDAFQHTPAGQNQIAANPPTPNIGPSQFDHLERYANLGRAPRIQFKDLEAIVTSTLRFNALPIEVRADFIPLTPASVLSNITLQFDHKNLQFQQADGVAKATVNLYARLTTMAYRVVNVFEDVVAVAVPSSMLEKTLSGSSLYQKTVPLAPGRYRLNIVAKDVAAGNMASYGTVLDVPRFDEDKLAASSLILADQLERLPSRSIGAGQFAIGDTKVRPRPGSVFRNDEVLGIYIQLYHFLPNAGTNKPEGAIEYDIRKNGSNQSVLNLTESLSDLEGSAAQLTVKKALPLRSLTPGSYTLTIKVTDNNRNQTISPSSPFTVM